MSLHSLLRERYSSAAPDLPDNNDLILETILKHRSIRHYRNESLPEGILELLVAAGQSAASSSNLQTWSVVALENPERKAQASVLCGDQEFIRQAPLFLIFCADLSRLAYVAEEAGLPCEGLEFTEMFLMASIDASLAAQNIAIAAEGIGLGICYAGAARNHPRELAEFLGLPSRVFVVFGMAVGWPAEPKTAAIKPRLPQATVLHRESYSTETREVAITEYNATMREFYEEQAMRTAGDWSMHSARRIATVESLRGRDKLRAILAELGFENR